MDVTPDTLIAEALHEAGVVAFELVGGQALLGRVLAWGTAEVLIEQVSPTNHACAQGRYGVPKSSVLAVRLAVAAPMAELDLASLG